MRFVVDECIPAEVGEHLRADGHEVVLVGEISPGIPDLRVLSYALDGNLVVVTADKDFGDLVYRDRQRTAGVILLRAGGIRPVDRARLLSALVREHATELLGAFTVLTPTSLRIRRLD